jgi:hypothetical protein
VADEVGMREDDGGSHLLLTGYDKRVERAAPFQYHPKVSSMRMLEGSSCRRTFERVHRKHLAGGIMD